MKIKICGICRAEDAALAAECGADYIGVILAERGPRRQSLESAARIFDAAGAALRVGVFADQPLDQVVDTAAQLRLHIVQLHGGEAPGYVSEVSRSARVRVWKAVAPHTSADLTAAAAVYGDSASGILLDHAQGGSGERFDWNLAVRARELFPERVQLIVAGGLNPDNVRNAVQLLQPDVLDVASGVEARTCEKSRERIEAFVRNARS